MQHFFTLISIENTKIWKRLSSRVMLVILLAIIVTAGCLMKFYTNSNTKQHGSPAPQAQQTQSVNIWKSKMQQELDQQKQQLAATEKSDSKSQRLQIGAMKKSVAEMEYRLQHNVKPAEKKGIWDRVTDMSMVQVIALMLLIVCATTVAGEFSEGTMKMMIPRPFTRPQILSAKLVSTLLYGLVLLFAAFFSTTLLMGALYGFDGFGSKELLWFQNQVFYVPGVLKTALIYGLDFLQVLAFVTLGFAISAIFRSRAAATGISLFLLLVGGSAAQMLAVYFSWGKYIPISVSLSSYITTGVVFEGTSLPFSLVLYGIYVAAFLIAGYCTFAKRDI